jgi:hypothetical protein
MWQRCAKSLQQSRIAYSDSTSLAAGDSNVTLLREL